MDTPKNYPSPVYEMWNVNWSAFLEGILPTLQKSQLEQWHQWKAPIRWWNIRLLLLLLWLTDVEWAIVHTSWLLRYYPNWRFFATSHPTPRHATPHHPTHPPQHPIPSTPSHYPISSVNYIKDTACNNMKFSHQWFRRLDNYISSKRAQYQSEVRICNWIFQNGFSWNTTKCWFLLGESKYLMYVVVFYMHNIVCLAKIY